MLQSMGLQRARHDSVTEQQQLESKFPEGKGLVSLTAPLSRTLPDTHKVFDK